MARKKTEFDGIGSDSFLDVVTNIVGILIILVVVVGIRVKNAPPAESLAETPAAPPVDPEEIRRLESAAASAERRAYDLERQLEELKATSAAITQQSEALSVQAALDRRKLDEARQAMDGDAALRFDSERLLDETEAALSEAQRELERTLAERKSAETVEVVSYHTPLGRTVNGEEVHFQIRGNRVAYVPKDDLEKALVRTAQNKAGSLLNGRREATLVVGPILDYRLKALLRRVDRGVAIEYGAVVSSVELVEYVLLPTSNELGETPNEALDPNSEFWSRVLRANPRTATITLWTEADGFDAFRQFKKSLYERGYAVACRVLPEGHPIGGSPQGSKSVRQ